MMQLLFNSTSRFAWCRDLRGPRIFDIAAPAHEYVPMANPEHERMFNEMIARAQAAGIWDHGTNDGCRSGLQGLLA